MQKVRLAAARRETEEVPGRAECQRGSAAACWSPAAHQSNRIVRTDFMPNSVVEKDAHDIPDLRVA